MSDINATQQFDVQEYEDPEEDEASQVVETGDDSYDGDNYGATQAFAVPESTVGYVTDDFEETDQPMIQETQAFSTEAAATQAFSINAFDDTPNDDPMLYGDVHNVTLDSTQQFAVAEYAVVGESVNTTGGSDGDYGVPSGNSNQNYITGLDVVEDRSGFDDSYEIVEQEVAVEEVVEGDEAGSDIGEPDEIASPDPEEVEEDEEQEEEGETVHRANRIASDDDAEEKSDSDRAGDSPTKRSRLYVDDDDGSNERALTAEVQSDGDEYAENKSEVGELIANIFGESDEEGGASDAEEPKPSHSRKTQHVASDSETKDSDDVHDKLVVAPDFISDFDLMMERRRAENRRRYRKRKDYDIVNDSDDVINDLISQMKHAAKADTELNKQQKPALSKRKLLPTVVKQLKKSDLQSAFIELGVVTVLADWLSPLPDGSLPALEIRTELLKVLQQFPTLDHQILKSSSIGKAVMFLYKHPKEIKENKERAGKLINEWARPIFSLQSDYRSLSKEERVQRDYEHMPLAKKRRMSSIETENKPKPDGEDEEERPLRPGDKGWIGRARVPQPSTKDYVVRPKWNVEAEVRNTSNKRGMSAMDRKIREIKERTKPKKAMRAVGVSIEGRKMMF